MKTSIPGERGSTTSLSLVAAGFAPVARRNELLPTTRCTRPLLGLLFAATLTSPAWAGDTSNAIVVTTTADNMDAFDQQCSLREALSNANTNTAFSPVVNECPAGSGTATDAVQLASGATYLLTLAGAGDTSGDLDVLDDPDLVAGTLDVTIGIIGGDTHATIQQQVAGERVFGIVAANVSIADVTIRGGSPNDVGGGILNDGGTLALDGVEIYDNTAVSGAGLYNNGTAYIMDSDVTFNVADLIGGGIFHEGGTLLVNGTLIRGNIAANGGGIYNSGASLTIEAGSELQSNYSTGNGAGILNSEGGALLVFDSAFSENISQENGGGIHSDSDVPVGLTRTDFTGNEAKIGGGVSVATSAAANIIGGHFVDNTAVFQGGALQAARFGASGTTFEGNTAKDGGAVFAGLSCVLTDSLLIGNTAERGGGGFCQMVKMRGTRVQGNSASQRGGGMYAWRDSQIDESTFAFNVAAIDGGALWMTPDFPSNITRSLVRDNVAQGDGGGVWVGADDSFLHISNTTISGNSTPLGSGSGLFIELGATVRAINVTLADNFPGENLAKYGDLTLQNSIITTPGEIDCVVALDNPEIESLGNNLSDDDTCVGLDFATDQIEVDVLLAPLAHTGGDTMTHALLAGSPAIDSGDNAACNAEPVAGVDQRNGARDVGLNCDIGAHEQGAVVSLTLFADGFE